MHYAARPRAEGCQVGPSLPPKVKVSFRILAVAERLFFSGMESLRETPESLFHAWNT